MTDYVFCKTQESERGRGPISLTLATTKRVSVPVLRREVGEEGTGHSVKTSSLRHLAVDENKISGPSLPAKLKCECSKDLSLSS